MYSLVFYQPHLKSSFRCLEPTYHSYHAALNYFFSIETLELILPAVS